MDWTEQNFKVKGETGYEALILQFYRIGQSLTLSQRQQLELLHKARGNGCNAHGEGLYCCIDFLLGDFTVDVEGG